MASQQAIAKASREFLSAIQSQKTKDTADIPVIIDRFKRAIGGAEKLADMLLEDFQRCRGADLPPEERAVFRPKEQIIQRYHQMLLGAISDKDSRISQYDLSSLSEDDLKSILLPLAVELVRSDAAFRSEVLGQAERDRDFIDGEYTLEVADERGEHQPLP